MPAWTISEISVAVTPRLTPGVTKTGLLSNRLLSALPGVAGRGSTVNPFCRALIDLFETVIGALWEGWPAPRAEDSGETTPMRRTAHSKCCWRS
jgi:hypothetical protein